MADKLQQDLCQADEDRAAQLRTETPQVVRELVATCLSGECYDHVSPAPIPSPAKMVEIIDLGRRVLFPGYFDQDMIDPVNLEYQIGLEVTRLFNLVSQEIAWAVQHDCIRKNLSCTQCEARGQEAALEFVRAFPGLRKVLAGDVEAALVGDPASRGADDVIFSYPGLFAISVYRMAHVLYHLGVPLIPRMMAEHAHSRTGIDIHPNAHIGGDFFIDHGTGVVIGATAVIGDRVRIYQGVTLGAMSVPRDAVPGLAKVKRHPTIEDDVVIYAQATILGGETVVGARSVIGGNVWLTESVPSDSKVFLKKPELIIMKSGEREKKTVQAE